MEECLRVALAGFSGSGKTTIANCIHSQFGLPFISGSYSELVPSTKDVPHSYMIQGEARDIFEKDVQLLNLRYKMFRENQKMVSDRSFLDSATYMIQKLSHRIPECEVEDFIEKCKMLNLMFTDKLIFIDFTHEYWEKWKIEDNGKRVTNRFYQEEISNIMWNTLISHFGEVKYLNFIPGACHSNLVYRLSGEFNGIPYKTDVLKLYEIDHNSRMAVITKFINGDYR